MYDLINNNLILFLQEAKQYEVEENNNLQAKVNFKKISTMQALIQHFSLRSKKLSKNLIMFSKLTILSQKWFKSSKKNSQGINRYHTPNYI